MTQEELDEEIEVIREQLKKAHEASKDEEILGLVDELNILWEKANVIMKENMKKDNREPLQ
tara:strand:- start:1813 stop:1995 length:183 start_codon:yes stop_codon:yes gene_type:complete